MKFSRGDLVELCWTYNIETHPHMSLIEIRQNQKMNGKIGIVMKDWPHNGFYEIFLQETSEYIKWNPNYMHKL